MNTFIRKMAPYLFIIGVIYGFIGEHIIFYIPLFRPCFIGLSALGLVGSIINLHND